jgi:benzoyl-CoA-dihydrodiol lyase
MASMDVVVSFSTHPDRYRHWKLDLEGDLAWLRLDVEKDGGLVPGYELKHNTYDLGVDIELYDATQRLRFEHPEVRVVVLTGTERVFSAGANIRMLAGSSHPWKVNFCKFTNETRCAMEDASSHSGQVYVAAVNGAAAGGGYELALACELILLVDDNTTAVSLPETPLLGVLPGTGGLTRLVDKRHVRRDRADAFATRSEGVKGSRAVEWGLADEALPRHDFRKLVAERARQLGACSRRPRDASGARLPELERRVSSDAVAYPHVRADLDRGRGAAIITVQGPEGDVPESLERIHALGAAFWPLAMTRELEDLVLHLRTNEPGLGTWVVKTAGKIEGVLAFERVMARHSGSDWLVNEVRHYFKRVLKRLDVTSRSLVALIEPGSCFAGALLELALACDRQYMLDGVAVDDEAGEEGEPARIVVSESNFGAFPMANGLTRLGARFFGHEERERTARQRLDQPLFAKEALHLGLVTFTPDGLDWEEEVRMALEERASFSPDALTGMEANLRFVGPETMETKIFGRLSAWQNWVFSRHNAAGPEGALRRYGTGQRPVFDRRRA